VGGRPSGRPPTAVPGEPVAVLPAGGRRISPARDSTETGFRMVRAETGELRLSREPFNH